jgi:hypothetical protein
VLASRRPPALLLCARVQVYRKALLVIHTDKLPETASAYVSTHTRSLALCSRRGAPPSLPPPASLSATSVSTHGSAPLLASARYPPVCTTRRAPLVPQDQVLAQEVFDALREAWSAFQHEL